MGHDLVDRAKHGDKEAFTALVVPLGDRPPGWEDMPVPDLQAAAARWLGSVVFTD